MIKVTCDKCGSFKEYPGVVTNHLKILNDFEEMSSGWRRLGIRDVCGDCFRGHCKQLRQGSETSVAVEYTSWNKIFSFWR